MSIFRIYGDNQRYLNFVIPGSEVISKLGGRDNPFHIDRTPKPYSKVWTQALQIDFHYGNQGKDKSIPDITENNGRLFLSPKAYDALNNLLESCGEFLPVYHEDGKGYIFNPLMTAEDMSGIDNALTTHDTHGNLENFGFIEDKVKPAPIFRTALDSYLGIFCSAEFKEAVESLKLNGICFSKDISNPINTANHLSKSESSK
jgi:hypothetical protein